ncbi:MAG TPA: serine/threonine-protein kinase [Gemmatimonadales bacterium]|nr:serine/threonine-protein kinase [Gemmatimonadales bacterium]
MMNGLDADQWQRAGALFHELVTLNPEERTARLDAMQTDPALRSAVEALLAGDAAAESRLPVPGFGLTPTASPSADPFRLIGQTVGHFRVEGHLASGGMGVVYRATDLQLHRPVALKFLLPFHQPTASAMERFLGEARSAGALDHPNLCPVYEVGESTVGPFLAMPWYDGETLKDRLARTGPLSPEDALAIVEQIAAGLQRAHMAGIIHRDIKPGNVMLLPDGTVKILDFGLAKAQADASHSHELLGTVGYMAPEQIRRGPVDARTDLWALGVMLYEMLGGERPFTGQHEAAVLYAIDREDPRPLSRLRNDLPPGLETLVLRLLEKDAAARYPGAPALIEAIGAIRRQQGGPVSPRHRTRRTRLLVIAGGALLLVGAYLWLGPDRSLVASGVIAPHDKVVVAEFSVPDGDSLLRAPLTSKLTEMLGESRIVAVIPRSQVAAVLAHMRRPAGTRLDLELALEVARREGARAVVVGDLASLGAGYLVTVRLVAATTGDQLLAFQESVRARERDLLPALDRIERSLRRRIGESLRDVQAPARQRRLTTASLEALRLFEEAMRPGVPPQSVVAGMRRAVGLDSSFAYAWLVLGNSLMQAPRLAARDSAFTKMYRFREGLGLFETTQVEAFYWKLLALDRGKAIKAYEDMLARDSTARRAIVLNLANHLNEVREFARAEAVLRRYQRADSLTWQPVRGLVFAKVGQGRIAEADSILASYLARYEELRRPGGDLGTSWGLALAQLRFDTAKPLLGALNTAASASTLASIARVEGQLAMAHQLDAQADLAQREYLRAVEISYEPAFSEPLRLASEELWLVRDPERAAARLAEAFASHPVQRLVEIEDRVDAVQAVALLAAAGRPRQATTLLGALLATSDDVARRAMYTFQHEALGEIALAEGRPREAMSHFRQSDLGADGLPATACAVCVLPRLARAAEHAGWADSARVFWERYVSAVSEDRTETDQWFLAMAYRRLQGLFAAAGDGAKAETYGAKAAALWRYADHELRP